MGFWNEPKCLEKSAAKAVAKLIFRNVTDVAKQLAERMWSKHISKEEYIDYIKKLLTKTREWWRPIPGLYGRLGNTLQEALDEVTEISPDRTCDAGDSVIALLLKLLFLDTVVIDRDYANSCGLCTIPFAYEEIMCSILKEFTFGTTKLVFYGAMYPSIVEIIIENSKDLKYLAISQVNLTDDIMDSISKCSNLEVIHLMHPYIWLAVSTPALCKGFFKQLPEESVSACFRSGKAVPLSFPELRVLDIGPCMISFVINFYKWLLYYYDVKSVHLEWKTHILEEGGEYSTEKLILPLIDKGKLFQLESLYLNADFLSMITPLQVKLITKSFPNLTKIHLHCDVRNKGTAVKAGEKLKALGDACELISKLYVNISTDENQTVLIVTPFFNKFGPCLSSLTITSELYGQHIQIHNLVQLISLCPNLKQLKLLFVSRYSVKNDEPYDPISQTLSQTKLTELWFHEESPWNMNQGLSHITDTQKWITLLSDLLHVSPNLNILSVSVCESMTELMKKLESNVCSFHLHVKDGCEWNVDELLLINLIRRFPNLRNVYLEELDGTLFWNIKRFFSKTNLNVFWGNLAGWPRS